MCGPAGLGFILAVFLLAALQQARCSGRPGCGLGSPGAGYGPRGGPLLGLPTPRGDALLASLLGLDGSNGVSGFNGCNRTPLSSVGNFPLQAASSIWELSLSSPPPPPPPPRHPNYSRPICLTIRLFYFGQHPSVCVCLYAGGGGGGGSSSHFFFGQLLKPPCTTQLNACF